MEFKEQARRKYETYAQNTETSPIVILDDMVIFYTKDANGAVRKHVYTEAGRTIDLVTDFPEEVKEEVKEVRVEPKAVAPKKEGKAASKEGIVAKAVRKLKGE